MAKFEKGNKLGGRTPGAKGKATIQIREVFTQVIEDNLEQLNEDIRAISKPETRVKLLLEMAKFVVPTLKAISSTFEGKEDIIIDFSKNETPKINIRPIEWVE